MLYNASLSEQTKNQLIERILAFPEAYKEESTLHELLRQHLVIGQRPSFKSVRLEVRGRLEMAALEVQDAQKTIKYSRLITAKSSAINATITAAPLPSWLELKDKAVARGRTLTRNNDFGILDAYYRENIQPKLAENLGSASNASLYPSLEYQDLELLLQILQEVKAKPMFIIVPVNGLWYDYTGFPLQERIAYYARLETMVRDKGFQVANFGDHEYDTYFLQDIMHLGWKGWVNVDEALDQFYHAGT